MYQRRIFPQLPTLPGMPQAQPAMGRPMASVAPPPQESGGGILNNPLLGIGLANMLGKQAASAYELPSAAGMMDSFIGSNYGTAADPIAATMGALDYTAPNLGLGAGDALTLAPEMNSLAAFEANMAAPGLEAGAINLGAGVTPAMEAAGAAPVFEGGLIGATEGAAAPAAAAEGALGAGLLGPAAIGAGGLFGLGSLLDWW